MEAATHQIIDSDMLLDHWQGHRRLTRKVIETFPEDKLFDYSIGGMRPFVALVRELASLAGIGVHGVARGDWNAAPELNHHREDSELARASTKRDLVALWDRVTDEINSTWPTIPAGRFHEVEAVWGMYEGPVWSHVLYFIDNENHPRGQGYVYLRSLGIEPPFFWDRD